MTKAEILVFGIPPDYFEKVRSQKGTRSLVVFKKDAMKSHKPPFCCFFNDHDDGEEESEIFWDRLVIKQEVVSIKIFNRFATVLRVLSSLMYVLFAAFRMRQTSDSY